MPFLHSFSPESIVSLLPEETFLVILLEHVPWLVILWECLYFTLIPKRFFFWIRTCRFTFLSFFFQHFKNIHFLLAFHAFWEIYHHLNDCPAISNMSFSPGCFQSFSIMFSISIVMCDVSNVDFGGIYSYFGVHLASWICTCVFSKFWESSTIISSIFFCTSLFLSPSRITVT